MSDNLPYDMLHAAGHAHMDLSGQYDAPAMRAAIAAALRVLAEFLGPRHDGKMRAYGANEIASLAARVEHPAEEAR